MSKINRFKKKSLDEEVKNIVSSKAILEVESINIETNNSHDKETKIIITKKEKTKMSKLGTSIRLDLKSNLDKISKKYNRTTNSLVTILLDNLYDENNKNFNINIDKKESFKITSYHIKEKHMKAIEKLSKLSGHNKSEIFNILIEEALNKIQ